MTTNDTDLDPDRAAPSSPWRRYATTALIVVLTIERLLFGIMFTITGSGWLFRQDSPDAYLVDQISSSLPLQPPPGWYAAFLDALVLPNPGLFATVVGVGELLTGLSLLLGFPARYGALGGIFLTLNYSIAFGNGIIPPRGNTVLAVLLVPLLSALPYRRFAIRRGRRPARPSRGPTRPVS